MTETASARRPVSSVVHWVALATTLIGDLVPLVGVLFWDWDTFQLLMLYWMETVILAFWTLLRLARLPVGQTGNITVNGVTQPATNAALVRFFSLHAGVFIAAHLLFLCALFSGAWFKKVHGPASFFSELLLANGVWVGLLIFFVAAWLSFASGAKAPFQQRLEQRLKSTRMVAQAQAKTGGDAVGATVAPLYIRIFIMQVAIILGAWFAQAIGSLAPLLLVIVLKTLVDLALGSHAPSGKGFKFSTSSVSIGS